MADWSKPTVTSNYVTFVDEVKNRDIDAITLQLNPLTNPPVGAIKLVRSPSIKFQEWDGTTFQDRVLSVLGGGTGMTSLANLGTAMNLGTMAYQNANAIAVTGGTVAGLTSSNITINGTTSITGNITLSGYHYQNNTTPNHAMFVTQQNNSIAQLYAGYFKNSLTPASWGVLIVAGNDKNDQALTIVNGPATTNYLVMRGDGALIINYGLRVPIGTNMWVAA